MEGMAERAPEAKRGIQVELGLSACPAAKSEQCNGHYPSDSKECDGKLGDGLLPSNKLVLSSPVQSPCHQLAFK